MTWRGTGWSCFGGSGSSIMGDTWSYDLGTGTVKPCSHFVSSSIFWSVVLAIFTAPHSEGMGKVMFSQASVRSHLRGGGGAVPNPRSRKGGYPIPGLDQEGYPILLMRWEVPHPRSGWGGTSSQVWTGGTPSLLRGGTPIQDQDGGGTLVKTWWGYPPSKTGWGTPPIQDWMGSPLCKTGWGIPPLSKTGWGTPPPCLVSKASTCYPAGSVPLAFRQEDFFV